MTDSSSAKLSQLFLTILALWPMAVVKPIFDALGNSPEYWTANRFDAFEIVLYSLGFTLIPAIISATIILMLVRRQEIKTIGLVIFSVIFFILLGLIIFHALSLSFGKPVIATAVGDTELIARDSGSILLVEAHLSPLFNWSSFIPKHIEHPE